MRSAIYRRPDLLRTWFLQTRTVSFARPLSTSSETERRPQFPLYRPDPQPSYPANGNTPQPRNIDPRSLPSDRRIRKSSKIQLTQKAIQDLPELQEDDLREFYAAVMESGRIDNPEDGRISLVGDPSGGRETKRLTAGERREVLEGLEGRLLGPRQGSPEAGPSRLAIDSQAQRGSRVYEVLDKLRAVQVPMDGGRVALGLVSRKEWSVLLDEVAGMGDGREAESILDLMSIHGVMPDDKQITQVMELYAEAGRVTDVARIHDLIRQSGLEIQESQQDLLIHAHLNHSPPLVLPAIDMLSSLATTGSPLPLSSYNILLNHLTTSQSTSASRALAWDLFANMRLNAHPIPTAQVFSTMINACSNSRDPQPERARDLWLEMIDTRASSGNTVQPERQEYNAIIKALSSTKSTYLEAFDLFRQMLAKHTEATFVPFDKSDTEQWSRFVPTSETFTALLEGTKRAGDLNRARWVLNEVVRLQGSGLGQGWKGVDEELMSGVFMTYASWKPVVRRQLVRGRQVEATAGKTQEQVNNSASEATETHKTIHGDVGTGSDVSNLATPDLDQATIASPSDSSHAAPLTSADAIREVDALFRQILQDTNLSSDATAPGPFTNVRLSARLINSYLSVHLAHAPAITTARQKWEDTWFDVAERGIKMNGWSMMQVLERCAVGDQGKDRDSATEWGRAIWGEYTTFAKSAGLDVSPIPTTQSSATLSPSRAISETPTTTHDAVPPQDPYHLGLGPRQIERTYRSMIRLLALSPSTPITDPTTLLASFYSLFPPSSILSTYTPALSPSRRFQIRMTERATTPESDIPPHILWNDVDVLHQRLVREGKKQELGWLKWVCKSYEVALRKRRRWRLKGKGDGEGSRGARLGGGSGSRGAIEDVVESEEVEDWA